MISVISLLHSPCLMTLLTIITYRKRIPRHGEAINKRNTKIRAKNWHNGQCQWWWKIATLCSGCCLGEEWQLLFLLNDMAITRATQQEMSYKGFWVLRRYVRVLRVKGSTLCYISSVSSRKIPAKRIKGKD